MKYAIQLCEAVDYLHKQKPPIIHGDIKPANVLLTPEDNIWLIDFSISGILEGKSRKIVGCTPYYASPEQEAAFHAVNHVKQNEWENRIGAWQTSTQIVTSLTVESAVNRTAVLPIESNQEEMDEHSSRPCVVDVRSDIYSIAATLYHILTGIKPDRNPDEIVPPVRLNGVIGENINHILMKALHKEP